MDLTDTSVTFAVTPPVEGFRFLLSRALTGEKKKNPQDELVKAFFDISRAHFHKVIHHAHQELPCSTVQCVERRTQHGALICTVNGQWRIWSEDVSVLRHGDDFATLATRTQIAEFKEELTKYFLVKHVATLGPRPQLPDSCEVRFLNRVTRWIVPPFGKAPETN